jgi:hypothetical protein
MIGTSEERKALIADLELRLEHVMKRIQMVFIFSYIYCMNPKNDCFQLMEDIEFMDRNYKAMFEKCVKAMEKLVRRKQEVTELKKVSTSTKV